jgi:Domain of unknown function (DUF4157)
MSTHAHASSKDSSAMPSLSPLRSNLLQRKCSCGSPTSLLTHKCAECNSKLQTKLAIGASYDPLEQEADRVADQVLAAPSHPAFSGESMRIQRYTGQATEGAGSAPASVDRVLASSGRPLEPTLQQDMEQRFGHDFSRVRVHSGGAAEQSAREVNANAYTVGHDIVFGAAQFSPGTNSGRRLLAHELTHVVQQSVGASMLRAQPKKKAPPKKAKPKVAMICGRPSRKVAGNSITKVNINVGTNTLTIEWKDPTKIPPGSAGTHAISPGSGLCCVDCNDNTVSQTSGSLCTPKGGVWPVSNHTKCALSGHPTAKNPTYFQRGGIAIHSGNTSSPPQSHGCARTSLQISELIHDNVIKDVTLIASSGTWAGSKCYLKEASKALSERKDVCDGNKLKSKGDGKKDSKKKQPGKINAPVEIPTPKTTPTPTPTPVPVAEALPEESDVLATMEGPGPGIEELPEMAADGPGPNNEPPSQESIGEIPIADLDPTEETDEGGDAEEETAYA